MNLKSFTAFFLLISLSGTVSADVTNNAIANSNHPIPVKSESVYQKKVALKLYPNPSTDGTIRVVSNTDGKLNFYIFDLEGTLLHQAVIKEKGKHTISNLKKGVYTYDAFYNDEGIEHGKLIVK